jgi:hypothetical protein
MKNPVTEVRIALELVVNVGSSWGPDCTLKQVEEQATEAAIRVIERMMGGPALTSDNVALSSTKVSSITTKEGR